MTARPDDVADLDQVGHRPVGATGAVGQGAEREGVGRDQGGRVHREAGDDRLDDAVGRAGDQAGGDEAPRA